MKKALFCMILSLVVVLTVLPTSAFAQSSPQLPADRSADDLAATGAGLDVHYSIGYFDKNVTVSWNSVAGAEYYVLWYMAYAQTYYGTENYNRYVQVGSAVRRDASDPCTYTFGHDTTLDYAFGAKKFKVEITAYSGGDGVLAEGESSEFQMDAVMLNAPTNVTLTQNGLASWSAVPNAAYYEVRVCNPSGVIQNGVTTAAITTCDVQAKMTVGKPYKITVTACNTGDCYRDSAPAESAVVTADFTARAIDGLKWSSNMLSWTLYPGADYYTLEVYKQSGSSWNKAERLQTEKTEYDLTDVFSLYGGGTYKVKVAAYNNHYYTPRSLETDSPAKTATVTVPLYTVSGTVTSFLSDTDEVHLALRKGNFVSAVASTRVTGKTASYKLKYVPEGVYTLFVSKENHVTRRYRVSVSGNKTFNVQICPLGDISGDGKITTKDYAMANAHAQKVNLITDEYKIACGDVMKSDGNITTADAARINAAAQKVDPLW